MLVQSPLCAAVSCLLSCPCRCFCSSVCCWSAQHSMGAAAANHSQPGAPAFTSLAQVAQASRTGMPYHISALPGHVLQIKSTSVRVLRQLLCRCPCVEVCGYHPKPACSRPATGNRTQWGCAAACHASLNSGGREESTLTTHSSDLAPAVPGCVHCLRPAVWYR